MGTIDDIMDEVARAVDKFPRWPTNPFHALAILGEEKGELDKSVVQWVGEARKGVTEGDVRAEAVQTAAMAVRFLVSLDAGAYDIRTTWHHQENPVRV